MGSRVSARLALAAAFLLTLTAAAPARASDDDLRPDPLGEVIARLETLLPAFGSTGVTAISVTRFDTASSASLRGSQLFKAASVIKPIWVAAALDHVGVDGVVNLGHAALYASSDSAAGYAIDVAGGLDRVNRWAVDRGLSDTITYEWRFDRDRRSRLYPGPLRGLNTTTTDDLVDFWELVYRRWVLSREGRAAFLEWTTGHKSSVEGDRLVARLPEDVAAASAFKMGWLPVGREYELHDDEGGLGGGEPGDVIIFEAGAVDIGAGLIRVPGGPAYAIAIATFNGTSWPAMTSWLEYASCAVHAALAHDPADCTRTRDPSGIRNRVTAPAGRLEMVRSHHGFLTVGGWAADPDAWWRPSLVAITVDGARVGTVAAIPTGLQDLARPRFQRTLPFEASAGEREVCAIGLNDGSGADTPLGCVTVEV